MSEPVSKAEIEDVLSSIRRLVSENSGAIRREPEPVEAEKLVLTPAFRVDAAANDDGDDSAQDATPEAAVAQALEGAMGADSMADHSDDDDADMSDAEVRDGPQTPTSLEQRIAELEAAIGETAGEFEPDGSETVDEIGGEVIFQHQNDAAQSGDDDSGAPEAGTGAETEAETAAETDADADDDTAPDESQDWEDVGPDMAAAAESAEDAEAWDEIYETGAEAAGLSDEDAEAVIDEDALREMVARMVREELQGSVGERITHNVRRMVRREIARALSLQDFE